MFRTGTVASVDAAKMTVRVTFHDSAGEHESGDLQMVATRAGDYALPAADDVVLCALDDGPDGLGWVIGFLYPEGEPPLSDAGQRSIASGDLRLGADPETTDKVSLSSLVDGNFSDQKTHFDALEAVITGPPITEPGNGAPSAFQTALAAALGLAPYPTPDATGADSVSAS